MMMTRERLPGRLGQRGELSARMWLMLLVVAAFLGHWIGHNDDDLFDSSGLFETTASAAAPKSSVIVPSSIPPQIVVDQAIERSKNPAPLFVLSPADEKKCLEVRDMYVDKPTSAVEATPLLSAAAAS